MKKIIVHRAKSRRYKQKFWPQKHIVGRKSKRKVKYTSTEREIKKTGRNAKTKSFEKYEKLIWDSANQRYIRINTKTGKITKEPPYDGYGWYR